MHFWRKEVDTLQCRAYTAAFFNGSKRVSGGCDNESEPELDQLHQICSIIITITPPNFSITLQLLCAKNRKLQL